MFALKLFVLLNSIQTFAGASLSYELNLQNKNKSYVIGIESFRIARNDSSSTEACNPLATIVYEPVLPHFDWIAKVLNGDPMCVSSQFRLKRKDLIRFCIMIAVSTVIFLAFLVFRHCWNSADAADDDRAEGSHRADHKNRHNRMSYEKSMDKMNLPKIMKHGSISQSTD